MKKRALSATLIVAAILAATNFSGYFRSASPQHADARVERRAADGQQTSLRAVPETEEDLATSSFSGSAPILDKTSKLSELTALAMRTSDQRGQAIAELQQALIYCRSMAYSLNNPSHRQREALSSAQDRKRSEWRASFVRQFCDEPGVSPDQLYSAALNELPPDDPFVQTTLLAGEPSKPDPLVMEHARRLASQSTSPAALEQAATYLRERGEEIPAMKALVPPGSLQSADGRAKAQDLAILMVTCDSRGGCGPNGINTFLLCNNCDPGLTMEQHWKREYSPDTMAFARAIAARIESSTQAR